MSDAQLLYISKVQCNATDDDNDADELYADLGGHRYAIGTFGVGTHEITRAHFINAISVRV